ncbi:MAG: secondary thiamine-phosphate synthase enzyme YjbQ [Acidobacteriota bacterium]
MPGNRRILLSYELDGAAVQVIEIKTTERNQVVDITSRVRDIVKDSGVADGLVTVFVPHTTAAVTINENADPSVKTDILIGLERIAPENTSFYRHAEGNSDAHIKASLVGLSVTVIIDQGRLILGTWQGILFMEFDGPRRRHVYVKVT